MSIYDTDDAMIILPNFVSMIRDTDIPVKDFAHKIVKWLSFPKYRKFEPYSALYRDSLASKKNGKESDPKTWTKLLPRIEKIHECCMKNGSVWAKIISSETIAHRWFDMEYHLKEKLYRDKWTKGYDDSYSLSLSSYQSTHDFRFLKFVDSSLYWKANAFYRLEEFPIAKDIFCKICNRCGKKYHLSDAFHCKIKFAKSVCKGKIDLKEKMDKHKEKYKNKEE